MKIAVMASTAAELRRARALAEERARGEAVLHVLEPLHAVDVLEIAQGGRWFRFRGQRVDLARRQVLVRVLWALAQARIERPNGCVSIDEVVAAAWPNERMQRKSGENRARVALSTLRGLGLRGLLLSRAGCVLLDPAVRVVRVSDDGAAMDRQASDRR